MAEHTRLIRTADATTLAELIRRNREHLAPWDPLRPESYFTEAGQHEFLGNQLAQHALGTGEPRVILEDGEIVGRISLSGTSLGPFRSAILGYWLDHRATGRGVMGRAVAEMVGFAFTELRLHRLEAGTLPHNLASQKVLARAGFQRFGYAPGYLAIAGRYQDHILFQLLNDAAPMS